MEMKDKGPTVCQEIKTQGPLPAKLLLPSPSHTAPSAVPEVLLSP